MLHCHQRRTEPWPQVTCRKFHKVWNVTFEICEWTDRYIHWCSTVPYWGQINNVTTTTSSTFCFHSTSLVFWSYCRSGWVSQQHTTGGNRAATYTAVSLLQQDNAISQQWWNNTCRAFSAARNWSFSSSSTDIRLWFHGAVPSTDRIQQHFNNTITLYNQVLHTHTQTHNHFTVIFPGLPGSARARRKNFWTFMVQGRITEADTPTIRLGATPSGLISDAPPSFHHFYSRCPSCRILACIPSGQKLRTLY